MKWPLSGGLMIDSPAVPVAAREGRERGEEFRDKEEEPSDKRGAERKMSLEDREGGGGECG